MKGNSEYRRRSILRTAGVSITFLGATSMTVTGKQTVLQDGEFRVEVVDAPDRVVAGKVFDMTIRITNNGSTENSTDVSIDGIWSGETVTVGANSSKTVTIGVSTRTFNGGDGKVFTIGVDGDEDRTRVRLLKPAKFVIKNIDVQEELPNGHTTEAAITIANEGEVTDSTDVELLFESQGSFSSGSRRRDTSVSINGGKTTTLTVPVKTWFDTGSMLFTVKTNDTIKSKSIQVVEAQPAEFTVNINTVETGVEGTPVMVEASFKNIGDKNGGAEVTAQLSTNADVVTKEITADYGKQVSKTFSLSTTRGDAGVQSVTIDTGNHTATQEIEIAPGAFYTVEVTNINTPIPKGFPFEFSVDIKNVGDGDGDKQVLVSVDSEQVTEQRVELSSGESKEVPFTVETNQYNFSNGVTIDTGFESVTINPEIGNVPFFSVTDVSRPEDSVTTGTPVPVGVTVENRGDAEGVQTITGSIESGESTDVELRIPAGETKSTTISIPTTGVGVGEKTVTVVSENNSKEVAVTINKPTNKPTPESTDQSSKNSGSSNGGSSNDNAGAQSDSANAPGFGVGTAVASVMSTAYIIKQRVTKSDG